jgi:intracellular multiplication protein IcmE
MNDKNDLDTFEEFEDFGNEEFDAFEQPAASQGLGAKLNDLWHNNPGFKFGAIIATVVAIGGGAYAFMGGNAKPVTPGGAQSRVGGGETVAGTVGADTTPEYRDLLQGANEERAQEALQSGQSAIPTPLGNVTDAEIKKEEPMDPLAMWRQAEQQPTPPPAPILQQQQQQNQQQQQAGEDLRNLTSAMQQQIQSLMQAWTPTDATVVSFASTERSTETTATTTNSNVTSISNTTTAPQKAARVIVPAGDILYGAMITEANSDVPGPILAQVLSGPLKGGRLIGAFQVSEDFLVLRFTTLSINGRSYPVQAIALDPNTTLGGMATEVDQRYFARLVLPAAASFISRFGDVISQPEQTTTVSNGTVVVSQNKASTRDALYAGAGDAANQLSDFVDQEANRVKPLVRVASNTPIGIFFTTPVTDQTKGQ